MEPTRAGAGGGKGDTNTTSRTLGDSASQASPRPNQAGDSHCYNCGKMDHWAYKCPDLTAEQQAQLHMHIEADPDGGNMQEEGHQHLNVSFLQGDALPDNQAYLDGCSTVTAFKTDRYLKNVKTMPHEIKINCNAGAVTTNKLGSFGRMKVWYIPNRIANILSMQELEKLYRITYDSWEGYYVVHMPGGNVRFYKDEQGLPYIDLDKSEEEAATMLIQLGMGQQVTLAQSTAGGTEHTMLAEMVQANYEGCTKKDVIKA